MSTDNVQEKSNVRDELSTDKTKFEYTQAFSLFDRDEDGLINPKELSLLIRSLERNPSDNEIQQLIEHVVDQGNNLIDCNQFLIIMSMLEKSRETIERKELRQIFEAIDMDSNGLIDGEELRTAMRLFSTAYDEIKLTKEEVDEMIRELDHDKDGRLTFEEFASLFEEQM